MRIAEKLLPCPFCGRDDKFYLTPKENYEKAAEGQNGAFVIIACKNCHSQMSVFPAAGTTYRDAMHDLISAWNARKGASENA